jgi:choice-of-anchor C domain-containing protein
MWKLVDAGGGSVAIVNALSGRTLDADLRAIERDGTAITVFGKQPKDAPPHRRWKIVDTGDGTVMIVNVASGRVLDGDLQTIDKDGTKVQLWSQNDNLCQRWRIVELGQPPTRPHPADNLLVNGSFEDGPEVDEIWTLDPDSTMINGWKVTRRQIDIFGHCKAADGKRCLDLHGSPGFGGVAQTFDTKKTQRYRVTFSLGGNPWTKVKVQRMAVSAAGKTKEFTCDSTGATQDNPRWQTKEWEFVAIDDRTTLELYTLERKDEDKLNGPLIDNVRVAPK